MSLRSEAEALAAKIDDVYNAGYEKGVAEGGTELPEEAFVISGDCSYRFANNGWNWFIEAYGEKIKTKEITSSTSMFADSNTLKEVPFSLVLVDSQNSSCFSGCLMVKEIGDILCDSSTPTQDVGYFFTNCGALMVAPNMHGFAPSRINSLFYSCKNIQINDDFFDTWDFSKATSAIHAQTMFFDCHSLRRIPKKLFDGLQNAVAHPGFANTLYVAGFYDCYALDELIELPVYHLSTLQSNSFVSSFQRLGRVKNVEFKTIDGMPYDVKWKDQNIDLSFYVGFAANATYITNHNSGITKEKQVQMATDYERLKDDPDWFTADAAFSRYNHDSAVRTINSLPDTSAYLATAGGTNTIKFMGAAGSATDGGAINTLTEEEIAVATAKGWTVTFV